MDLPNRIEYRARIVQVAGQGDRTARGTGHRTLVDVIRGKIGAQCESAAVEIQRSLVVPALAPKGEGRAGIDLQRPARLVHKRIGNDQERARHVGVDCPLVVDGCTAARTVQIAFALHRHTRTDRENAAPRGVDASVIRRRIAPGHRKRRRPTAKL